MHVLAVFKDILVFDGYYHTGMSHGQGCAVKTVQGKPDGFIGITFQFCFSIVGTEDQIAFGNCFQKSFPY